MKRLLSAICLVLVATTASSAHAENRLQTRTVEDTKRALLTHLSGFEMRLQAWSSVSFATDKNGKMIWDQDRITAAQLMVCTELGALNAKAEAFSVEMALIDDTSRYYPIVQSWMLSTHEPKEKLCGFSRGNPLVSLDTIRKTIDDTIAGFNKLREDLN